MSEKATRHEYSPEQRDPDNLARGQRRLETLTYLNYEMRCHDHHVEPLRLDQWLKRGDERDALWANEAAVEDSKENEKLRAARLVTRQFGPQYALDMILHHASILQHNGEIIRDLSQLSCPKHGPKDWKKWITDRYADSKIPTYDKNQLKKDIETAFKKPSEEHSPLYCYAEADVEIEYQPKGPQFPRFPSPLERGNCFVILASNYWRFIPR
jgi:hypothetical protein